MPSDLTLGDVLSAYNSGVPDPENPSSGQITPAIILRAMLHSAAPGTVAPPVEMLPRATGLSAEDPVGVTPDVTAREYARTLSAGRAKPPDPFETITGIGGAAGGVPAMFGGIVGARNLAAVGKPEALRAMTKAEQMFGAGATPSEVYAATRISQGPEGGLRFEIPDYQSGFRPQAAEHIMPVTTGGQGVIEPKPGEIAVGFSPAKVVRAGQPALLEHAYAHPEAYEAYPDLRSLLLKFEDPLPELTKRGFVSRGGLEVGGAREIYLNPEAIPQPERMRSTLLHELQHGVQNIEGLPAGGGIGVPEVQRAADTAIAQRVADWKAQLDVLHGRRDVYIAAQQQAGRPESVQQLAAEFFSKNPDLIKQSATLHTNIDQAQRGVGRQMELTKQYKNLAGEVEARNVQARANMTPEELAATPPTQTADVRLGEQLLRYGNKREARIALDRAPLPEPAAAPYRTPEQLRLLSSEPLSFSERMAEGRDVAFQRAQRGQATGDYGLGSARRTAPEAPAGSFEDLAARQRAGFAGDKERILDEYRQSVGLPRLGTERPLLAPGEQDIQFNLERRGGGPPPEAPAVLRSDRPLFDLSPQGLARSHLEREQFDIPRTAAETVTPEYEKATSKANIARVNREVAQGIKEHGLDWHAMGQLRDRYIAELGAKKGAAEFEAYMREVGATSPNSNVEQNFRTASYYAQQRRAGEPLPQISIKRSTGNPYLPPREAPPTPYGNTAQGLHVMNLGLLERGEPYPLSRPKVPSFTENMLGNYRPVAVDRHNLRMWGIDAEAPNLTGYKHLERTQQGEAEKMGIHPAQYQAAPWPFYAKSGADPALKLFQNRVMATAEAERRTPGEVLRDFIRGTGKLLSLTPAGVLLAHSQDQNAQEPAR